MKREFKDQLNKLSKEVFGTSSRWKKIVDNGVAEPHERDREVMVPTKNGLEKKIFTDKKSIVKRYTPEEIYKLMLDILEKRKQDTAKATVPGDNGGVIFPAPSDKFYSGMAIEGNGIPLGTIIA